MTRRAIRRRAAVLLLPWAATTACRSYAPIALEAAPVDAPVRIALTDRGSADLADALGARTRELRGRVAERGDSAVVVHVSGVTREGADEEAWRGEPVRLPLAAVARIERESLSRSRTALFAGGVLAVLALAVSALGNGEAVRGGPGGGQPPPPR